MSISIGASSSISNTSSLNSDTSKELSRLSSGTRITSAADDAAGSAISSRFDTQQDGFNVALRNANDGISFYQTAEGALGSLTDNLQRIRELAISSGNGALNNEDRKGLQAEVTQLQEDNQKILDNSNFNGVKFFESSSELSFQTGPGNGDQIKVSTNLSKVIDESKAVSIGTPEAASAALEKLDASLSNISQAQSQFGAVQNRFESNIDNLAQARINNAEANSRIKDADMAKEASSLISKDILNQVDIALRAQANSDQKDIRRLIG